MIASHYFQLFKTIIQPMEFIEDEHVVQYDSECIEMVRENADLAT